MGGNDFHARNRRAAWTSLVDSDARALTLRINCEGRARAPLVRHMRGLDDPLGRVTDRGQAAGTEGDRQRL